LKTGIDHLPIDKQEELQEIVQVIKTHHTVEMIILFGSYSRGDWVDDRYKENGTIYEYRSDFDILVVIDTEVQAIKRDSNKRWRRKIHQESPQKTPLTVIFHGIDYLNQEIEDGNFFFVDVYKEGIMLYDSGKFQLATPQPLNAKERKHKAQVYFGKWFENADMFFENFKVNFDKGTGNVNYYNIAAFELHQTAERFFMCVMLVYTDYKPKLHDLEKLEKQVCRLDNRFKTIFPRTTPEEERLFILLKKAYIDSRYKLDYNVAREELEYLSGCVTRLRNLTETACKGKIESFG
jgi:uncharacterized protein